jgi:hypothetical protein
MDAVEPSGKSSRSKAPKRLWAPGGTVLTRGVPNLGESFALGQWDPDFRTPPSPDLVRYPSVLLIVMGTFDRVPGSFVRR